MGSSSRGPAAASPEFLAVFRQHMDAGGRMSFARFMELALYAPDVGYYRKNRPRVGYGAGTDFFTASTSGPVFGELIATACATLLEARQQSPGDFTFVEIGAETPSGVLAGVTHPFRGVSTIRVGEPLMLEGRCVVFSNELFDAQPCRRFVFRDGGWRELGVALREGALTEIELASEEETVEARLLAPSALGREQARAHLSSLPPSASEGYVIDAPLAAADLARAIASQPWPGLFVACDYGKSWPELTEATPAGTARAYFQHTQSNDLLARPGEQDLTCHVCWDWIAAALQGAGFTPPKLESQEAFFIHHAGPAIAAISAAEAARFSPRKLSLLQLLHPGQLGQKFQVMHAWRA